MVSRSQYVESNASVRYLYRVRPVHVTVRGKRRAIVESDHILRYVRDQKP